MRKPDNTKNRLTPVHPGCVASINILAAPLKGRFPYRQENPCKNSTPRTAMPRSISSSGMKPRISGSGKHSDSSFTGILRTGRSSLPRTALNISIFDKRTAAHKLGEQR